MDDEQQPPVGTDAHLTGARRGLLSRLPRAARILVVLVLVIAVLLVLFLVVFPWFEEYTDDPTLDAAARFVATSLGAAG